MGERLLIILFCHAFWLKYPKIAKKPLNVHRCFIKKNKKFIPGASKDEVWVDTVPVCDKDVISVQYNNVQYNVQYNENQVHKHIFN